MTLTPAAGAQIDAARPDRNTWLSANAGSGKTRVLTDRVARLLLNGVQPQHILCLTYTKAAASEMQNRLFKRLGTWAMKPEDDLRRDLLELGEVELSASRLSLARQLFARAIETPGGLRIQTIHSFCASLLRRFPLEAGVAPAFTELEDRAARLLRAEIVAEMADRIAPDVIRRLTEVYSAEDFTGLVEEVARHRAHFAKPLGYGDALSLFDLPIPTSADHFISIAFQGDEAALFAGLVPLLATESPTMKDLGKLLAGINLAAPTLADLEALFAVFLYKDDGKALPEAKITSIPTKNARKAMGPLADDVDAFMHRVAQARDAQLALQAANKTAVLHAFAAAFLPLYEARKAALGVLDFDDLIARARALLTDPSLAAWVLFRLDGGIDHILVDEAQDTGPDQWQVIESLAAELTSGLGAQERPRTLFVVGDKKQSIYSFQGADAAAFDQKRTLFHARLAGGENGLAERVLEYSFRSSPAILALVDHTFTGPALAALGGGSKHSAFHETLAGRVDLWPPIEKSDTPEPGEWFDPVDLISPQAPIVLLAEQIAREIKATIKAGTQIPLAPKAGEPNARPVHAGDFLILVRSRSPLFHEIIRACKAANLPIAGADRLKLGAELAVKDLGALLAFLDTPEDDLSLAAVLRSPLCGWSEDALFRLAHGRKGYLWEALRDAPDHAATRDFLTDLRDQADFLRPYDLIERVLHRHDGRRKLLTRLGPEAEDGIDELLSQALAYERSEVPSLTGFLVWLETDDVDVKRQLDGEGQRIRVMTVHGAKGLEAPIVILPDTADYKPQERDEIYRLPDGPPVWKTTAPESPELIRTERAARQARNEAERLRLLYVAMTRARCWLIVAVAGEVKKPECWYNMIRAGAERMNLAGAERLSLQMLDGGVQRHSFGVWPEPWPQQPVPPQPVTLPAWAFRPAPKPEEDTPPLSPSALGGPKALSGEPLFDEATAKAQGTALHLLLEHLPRALPETWPALSAALIPDAARAAVSLAEARIVLSDPALAMLFGPETRAEVAVAGEWNGRRLFGSIDRLILSPDSILIVDYKSNAVVPDSPSRVPEGILRQMGAYAHIMAQIYPYRQIKTAILWTRLPQLMQLDPDIVRLALARTTIP
jgi:ATP-dependent helicase/nuclease subunit A